MENADLKKYRVSLQDYPSQISSALSRIWLVAIWYCGLQQQCSDYPVDYRGQNVRQLKEPELCSCPDESTASKWGRNSPETVVKYSCATGGLTFSGVIQLYTVPSVCHMAPNWDNNAKD